MVTGPEHTVTPTWSGEKSAADATKANTAAEPETATKTNGDRA